MDEQYTFKDWLADNCAYAMRTYEASKEIISLDDQVIKNSDGQITFSHQFEKDNNIVFYIKGFDIKEQLHLDSIVGIIYITPEYYENTLNYIEYAIWLDDDDSVCLGNFYDDMIMAEEVKNTYSHDMNGMERQWYSFFKKAKTFIIGM